MKLKNRPISLKSIDMKIFRILANQIQQQSIKRIMYHNQMGFTTTPTPPHPTPPQEGKVGLTSKIQWM